MSNKSITPYNNKGERHGYWERYCDDILWYKCLYQNGKEVGYSEWYSYTDKIIRKRYHL